MARRLGASCYCKNRCAGVGRHAWLSLLRESWRGWATLLLECTSVYDDEWPGASVLLLQELGAAGLGATPLSALLRGSTAWLKCTPAGVHSGGAQWRTSHEMSEEVSYTIHESMLQSSTARLLVRYGQLLRC